MTTERADFRFTVKEGDDGKPWTPKSATFKSGPLRKKVAPFEEPDGSDGDFDQVHDRLDIPDFLRRDVPPDRRPALGPPGDSLDDLQ
jgi:hypothetical protein